MKIGVSRTNVGHFGTDFVGIRGVSGTRYCVKCAGVALALPMDGRLAGWPEAATNCKVELEQKEILKTVSGRANFLPGK